MHPPCWRRAVLAGMLLLVARTAAGQEAAATREIAGLVARYDSVWNRKDTAAIRRLLAPEYQYFTSRGGVWSRDEVLGLAGSPTYVLRRARRSEIVVTQRPPVAVVTSRWEGEGSYRGNAFSPHHRRRSRCVPSNPARLRLVTLRLRGVSL